MCDKCLSCKNYEPIKSCNTSNRFSLEDMPIGASGYVTPWSIEGDYLDVSYESFFAKKAGGTMAVCLKRVARNAFVITGIKGYVFQYEQDVPRPESLSDKIDTVVLVK